MRKSVLGRGLSSLIPDVDLTENVLETDQILEIDIDLIYPNRNQPRKIFDEEKLMMLKESIESNGVIQPIIVTKEKDGYQIVAGERRWRASKLANLKIVPCIIRTYDDLMRAKVSIIENVQRDNLNVVEEAMAYQLLLTNYNLTQTQLSESIGKSRPYIANIIRILNLEPEIQDFMSQNLLNFGHAKALLMFPEELRLKYALKTIKNQLSVRQLEKLSKKVKEEPKEKLPKDLEIKKIEEMLTDVLGTRVLIQAGKSKGKIEIDYYDDDDLLRIIEIVKN